MSSEWKQATLGELVTLQRGYDLPVQERKPGVVPIMGSAGITGYHDQPTTKGPGVVIGRSGVGSMGVVSFINQDFWALNTTLYVKDFHGNDERFIYYLLSTINFRQFDTGSAQASLNRNLVYPHRVAIPQSVAEQRCIADMLSALEDEILLLRETNATLEAIVQTLFKSWFVDFDPVRAKQQGLVPEGMDEQTAVLFPNGFEESGLGPIPRGWKVGTMANLIYLHKGSVNPGTRPDLKYQHFSLPAFDAGQMPVIEPGSAIKSNKTTVPENAVLLSKLNPHIPRVWLPSSVAEHAVCSTEFLPFVPTGPSTTSFVYCLLAAPDFSSALCQLVTGTSNSHQRVKPDGVLSLPCIVPSAEVVTAFEAVANGLLSRLKANREQAQTLALLRDTLLPRLISGQLRLCDADHIESKALFEEALA